MSKNFSTKRYSPEQKKRAQDKGLVMFMWEMDKRHVTDKNHRGTVISACGTMSLERCQRIWAIIREQDQEPE